jgi:hypothetical protein
MALQLIADYDTAITRGGSSPEDRAKRRQFRHAGGPVENERGHYRVTTTAILLGHPFFRWTRPMDVGSHNVVG